MLQKKTAAVKREQTKTIEVGVDGKETARQGIEVPLFKKIEVHHSTDTGKRASPTKRPLEKGTSNPAEKKRAKMSMSLCLN
jgi:hypothetical protein